MERPCLLDSLAAVHGNDRCNTEDMSTNNREGGARKAFIKVLWDFYGNKRGKEVSYSAWGTGEGFTEKMKSGQDWLYRSAGMGRGLWCGVQLIHKIPRALEGLVCFPKGKQLSAERLGVGGEVGS